MKIWISLLLLLLVFGSCTIEKRLYNKGFHVEFNRNSGRVKQITSVKDSKNVKDTILEEPVAEFPAPENLNRKKVELTFPKEEVLLREQSITLKNKLEEQLLVPKQKQMETTNDQSKQPDVLPVQRFNNTALNRQSQHKMARQSSGSVISEEAIEFLLGVVVLMILLLCMAFPTFGAIVEMIVGIILLILLVVGVVWVIVWLCTADFGNFPWFWSGR